MDSKTTNFKLYRFHLLLLTSKSIQLEIFQDKKLTIDELKKRKNELFGNELDSLTESKSNKNPLKLHCKDDNFYLYKIAQKRPTVITKDFKTTTIDNEPYSYVIINNNPAVQKIAISDNKDAFSSPDVVKNILKKIFQKDLERLGLNIEIEALFDVVNFWKYVERHKNELTFINFQYIKPNLANISSALPEDFKNFADNVNSHESHITIKAPKRGRLENIDKSNEDINGLVEYAANGAGTIKLKVKNIRKTLSTKENPTIIQADEIAIEGAAEQVVKIFKSIVE